MIIPTTTNTVTTATLKLPPPILITNLLHTFPEPSLQTTGTAECKDEGDEAAAAATQHPRGGEAGNERTAPSFRQEDGEIK